MSMKIEVYQNIVKTIDQYYGLSKNISLILQEKFPDVAEGSIKSIVSLQYQQRMKINHHKLSTLNNQIVQEYKCAITNGEPIGILIRLALKHDLVLTSIARLILEHYYKDVIGSPTSKVPKSTINKMISDISQISDMRLAYEIHLCVIYDDQSGPITDAIRHSIGLEYELKLQKIMEEKNIIFRDEEYLRSNGYDKTPDIKLDVPVAIDGFIISWVESKALFGSPSAHEGYVRDQYLSYWNRFGPGLVIYWFGFVETIINPNEKRFIIRNDFPDNIVYMDPKSVELSTSFKL